MNDDGCKHTLMSENKDLCSVGCSMVGLLLNEERLDRTANAGKGELTARQNARCNI